MVMSGSMLDLELARKGWWRLPLCCEMAGSHGLTSGTKLDATIIAIDNVLLNGEYALRPCPCNHRREPERTRFIMPFPRPSSNGAWIHATDAIHVE